MASGPAVDPVRARKDPERRALIRRIVTIGVSAAVVLLIAVLAYFFPYRSLLPAIALPARGEKETRVHFIDVGEGDATLVEFSSGNCLLIDAGDGDFAHGEKIVRYLRGVKMERLTVVATHSDADHCGGIAEVLRNFKADLLYLPVIGGETGAYRGMLDAAKKEGVETKLLTRYDVIEDESGAYAVCLSPYSIDETDENDASALLYLHADGVNFLFGADVSSVRERRLMREYAADPAIFDFGPYTVELDRIDVLRVSHHGSASSSDADWLSLLGAEAAVISCGQDNRYSHPAEEAVERLALYCGEIYRTDELGDLIVTLSNGAYQIEDIASL